MRVSPHICKLQAQPVHVFPQQATARDVQGEVIEQQFGEKELCFRTLDLYTSAVLEASLNPTTPPKPEWRQAMDRMSEVTSLLLLGPRFRVASAYLVDGL